MFKILFIVFGVPIKQEKNDHFPIKMGFNEVVKIPMVSYLLCTDLISGETDLISDLFFGDWSLLISLKVKTSLLVLIAR